MVNVRVFWGPELRCNRTYGTCVIFSDNVRVRYFAVRWPHYMSKISYV